MIAPTDRLDPERRLALAYAPPARRDALAALWTLDAAIGAAIAGGSQPLVRLIKLAWWRERLAELDEAPPPAEPVLQAAALKLLPLGIEGGRLAALSDGWEVLASAETLGPEEFGAYAAHRGGLMFELAARVLGSGENDPAIGLAGQNWALVDLARRSSNEAEAIGALAAAADRLADDVRRPWPRHLRPLGMLAMLARRDTAAGVAGFERQGSPARILRMFRHRLTGR